jgi:hypothetical protein
MLEGAAVISTAKCTWCQARLPSSEHFATFCYRVFIPVGLLLTDNTFHCPNSIRTWSNNVTCQLHVLIAGNTYTVPVAKCHFLSDRWFYSIAVTHQCCSDVFSSKYQFHFIWVSGWKVSSFIFFPQSSLFDLLSALSTLFAVFQYPTSSSGLLHWVSCF